MGTTKQPSDNADTPEHHADAFHDLSFGRTAILLGKEDLDLLGEKTVVMAGVGGVGGAAAVTLARMGIGRFVLADPGMFDEPDLNRQWGATVDTLGRNKAEVYDGIIKSINPSATVEVFREGVTAHNLDEILQKGDVVVDGLDFAFPLPLRMRFYAQIQTLGRYCVSSPIFGFGTVTFVAAPDGMGMGGLIHHFVDVAKRTSRLPAGFKTHLHPDHIDALEQHIGTGQIPSSSIAATLSGAVQAAEVMVILLGERHRRWRAPVTLPHLIVTELLLPNTRIVPYTDLFPDYENNDSDTE